MKIEINLPNIGSEWNSHEAKKHLFQLDIIRLLVSFINNLSSFLGEVDLASATVL